MIWQSNLDIPAFDVRLAAGDPELVNIIAKNVGAIKYAFLLLLSIVHITMWRFITGMIIRYLMEL